MKKSKTSASELTLPEKVELLYGDGYWRFHGVERLGLPKVRVSDGPFGLRKVGDDVTGEIKSTCYPSPALLACSFDEKVLENIGRSIARECREENVDILLAPGVNIKRNPLCGRNFEYYSEDPLLSGKMGAAFIRKYSCELQA